MFTLSNVYSCSFVSPWSPWKQQPPPLSLSWLFNRSKPSSSKCLSFTRSTKNSMIAFYPECSSGVTTNAWETFSKNKWVKFSNKMDPVFSNCEVLCLGFVLNSYYQTPTNHLTPFWYGTPTFLLSSKFFSRIYPVYSLLLFTITVIWITLKRRFSTLTNFK